MPPLSPPPPPPPIAAQIAYLLPWRLLAHNRSTAGKCKFLSKARPDAIDIWLLRKHWWNVVAVCGIRGVLAEMFFFVIFILSIVVDNRCPDRAKTTGEREVGGGIEKSYRGWRRHNSLRVWIVCFVVNRIEISCVKILRLCRNNYCPPGSGHMLRVLHYCCKNILVPNTLYMPRWIILCVLTTKVLHRML